MGNGADRIAEILVKNNVKYVFAYAGGAVSFLIDAIDRAGIALVISRHEQASAFMASAYSKAGHGIGVCLATSGPGATNLITGIADAYYDYTPMVALTGQVDSKYLNNGTIHRQAGFQQVDIINMVEPITFFADTMEESDVIDIDTSYNVLKKAFRLSYMGKAPTLVDIPMDIQKMVV